MLAIIGLIWFLAAGAGIAALAGLFASGCSAAKDDRRDGGEVPPDGIIPDGGPEPDGGGIPDGGGLPDGGDTLDGGGIPDGGGKPDGGIPDGGGTPDGGSKPDGGGIPDGGGPPDGGADDDGGVPPDGGDDDGGPPDGGTPPPGINFHAATGLMPVADLDAAPDGIVAYGGVAGSPSFPPAVYRCIVDGIGPASCSLMATLPAGISPRSYFSTPFGYAIADAAPASGNPFDLLRIDETPLNPEAAVEGHRVVDQIAIPGTSFYITPAHPRGIAAHHASAPPRDRFFVAVTMASTDGEVSPQGAILCFADLYGNWASTEPPVISPGLATSALVTTVLDLGAGAKTYLVSLNAGAIDPADAYTAGISVFDPESSITAHVKTISLGDVAAAALPELPLDGPGTTAYVAIEAPARQLAKVNLVTNAVATVPLGGAVFGDVVDLAVGGAEAYLADSSGRVVFVDLVGDAVLGFVSLPDPPTALAVWSGYLYIAAGTNLIAIDPATVVLE